MFSFWCSHKSFKFPLEILSTHRYKQQHHQKKKSFDIEFIVCLKKSVRFFCRNLIFFRRFFLFFFMNHWLRCLFIIILGTTLLTTTTFHNKTNKTRLFFPIEFVTALAAPSPSPPVRTKSINNPTTTTTIRNIMGQTISSTQFFVYGRKHFTRTGYLKHVKDYTEPYQTAPVIPKGTDGCDNYDLTNKVVVVTGANSGIGKQIALYCASKNTKKLYMICRNEQRGIDARDDIIQQTSINPLNIEVLIADVGELHQVRNVVKILQEKETAIHAIVCNAGVLLKNKEVTSEQNEITFACHLLGGSYLLSSLLLPQLQHSSNNGEGRVIMVTSGGMYTTPLPKWDILTNTNPQVKYDGTLTYAYAKRGQVIVTEQLAQQYSDVTFVTAHPGWTDTPAVDDAFGENKKYLQPMRTQWEGAEGITYLIQTPKKNLLSGGFYLDRTLQTKHIGGPFMSEGSYTKNTPEEIQEFMQHLQNAVSDAPIPATTTTDSTTVQTES